MAARPIDGIAYTSGPGLVGALLVGAAVARSLAYAWDVPCIGVHHMEGHLLAPLLEPDPPQFPFVALLVSGGHTLLARVEGVGRYELLGSSLDDAAGEAFDKTAKLLGLGYPGGPQLAALAEQGRPDVFRFPRPLTERPGLDFSFSGLKTAVVVALRNHGELDDAGASRRGPRLRGGRGRYARDQVPAGARCDRRRARWSWRAAWAPTGGCVPGCSRWASGRGSGSSILAPSSAPTTRR